MLQRTMSETGHPRTTAQERHNREVWGGGDALVAAYAGRTLRPVEVVLLVRHREALRGRVLELGCGGGRLAGYLVTLAEEAHGLDLSAAMVDHCRRAYPAGEFRQGDLRDLSAYEPGAFTAVLAPFNVLDVLDDAERGDVLDGIRRLLRADGLLILSSHNRAFAPHIPAPTQVGRDGVRALVRDLPRLRRRIANRRRLRPLERDEPGYAVRNDEAHDYSLLHYYIARDDQAAQLAAHGYELLECRDLAGNRVEPGATAPECSELHYVARRAA